MPDFGKGGTREEQLYHHDVTVNGTAGEYLDYTLTAQGGNPLFVFSCAHRNTITTADRFMGHPMAVYKWRLFKSFPSAASPTDFTADVFPTDAFEVGMSFLGIVKYQLTVELHD